jgi:enoyl-CoA hydratase/carnithine racemase
LVNQVCPADELTATVMSVAKTLARKSALTLRVALRAVGEGLEMTQDGGCGLEAALFGVAGSSQDAKEGCRAFVEKRQPDWKDA